MSEIEVDVEWLVTGQFEGYPPYLFVWRGAGAEAQARGFIGLHADLPSIWTEGPHLHKRTVTRTPWEKACACVPVAPEPRVHFGGISPDPDCPTHGGAR